MDNGDASADIELMQRLPATNWHGIRSTEAGCERCSRREPADACKSLLGRLPPERLEPPPMPRLNGAAERQQRLDVSFEIARAPQLAPARQADRARHALGFLGARVRRHHKLRGT